MSTIGLTPTWGEIGSSLWYLATSGQMVALNHMRSEHARAFAMAEAFAKLLPDLTEEQKDRASRILCEELKKQGF